MENGRVPRLSACPVNVRFRWNDQKSHYERIEGSYKIVHDHKLELDERIFVDNDVIGMIKQLVMLDSEVRPSTVIKKVYENLGKKIKHLDCLNCLKFIRGDVRLDMQ